MVNIENLHNGMQVVDASGATIGDVEVIRFGDENPDAPGPKTVTAVDMDYQNSGFFRKLVDAFVAEEQTPDVMAERLIREGYIRIDSSLGEPDRFALMGQIAQVTEDTVHLTEDKETLISF